MDGPLYPDEIVRRSTLFDFFTFIHHPGLSFNDLRSLVRQVFVGLALLLDGESVDRNLE